MHEHSQEFGIRSMARVLAVSRSGFYKWPVPAVGRSTSERRRAAIDRSAYAEFFRQKQRYDDPKLTRGLAAR